MKVLKKSKKNKRIYIVFVLLIADVATLSKFKSKAYFFFKKIDFNFPLIMHVEVLMLLILLKSSAFFLFYFFILYLKYRLFEHDFFAFTVIALENKKW